MANLFIALEYMLNFEGGYSNDPVDHGGETNYGITHETLHRYLHDNPSAPVFDSVKSLTIKDVEKIYRWGYWTFDKVVDQRVATKIFDMAVNMGLGTAVKIVQKIGGTKIDGVWGPQTEGAVNAMDVDNLLLDLCQASVDHYMGIIKRDPTQLKFKRGWLRRANSVPSGTASTPPS